MSLFPYSLNYVAVKRLYKDLVHFQANCQAKMIGHIESFGSWSRWLSSNF